MKPSLIAEPYAHYIADILMKFENGKPLTNDQLNFLISHEKTLSNYALDLVIKYYLTAHQKTPDKSLSFTIPQEEIDRENVISIRDAVQNLLSRNLTHIDLKMTFTQFLQFKKVGLHELVYWHGPQFLSRTFPYLRALPKIVYVQWGKLFGVINLFNPEGKVILNGDVLMYFEERNERSLTKCILDYSDTHKIEYRLANTPTPVDAPEPILINAPLHLTPNLSHKLYEILPTD